MRVDRQPCYRLKQTPLLGMQILPAKLSDAAQIASCSTAAYQEYIPHIGKQPCPMLDEYADFIDHNFVWVVKHRADASNY